MRANKSNQAHKTHQNNPFIRLQIRLDMYGSPVFLSENYRTNQDLNQSSLFIPLDLQKNNIPHSNHVPTNNSQPQSGSNTSSTTKKKTMGQT
jgi:hypothetical protein